MKPIWKIVNGVAYNMSTAVSIMKTFHKDDLPTHRWHLHIQFLGGVLFLDEDEELNKMQEEETFWFSSEAERDKCFEYLLNEETKEFIRE